jgi:hypothetical protein
MNIQIAIGLAQQHTLAYPQATSICYVRYQSLRQAQLNEKRLKTRWCVETACDTIDVKVNHTLCLFL